MRTAYFQLSAIFQQRAENEYMWQQLAYGLEYSSNLRIMKIKVHCNERDIQWHACIPTQYGGLMVSSRAGIYIFYC